MIIERRNIEFTIKRYWSAEAGAVIEGEIPHEFKGSAFGPELRSFVIYQYYKNRVPHQKIIEMLSDWGIEISKGTVCTILNNCNEIFKEDLTSARRAGIKRSSDVTGLTTQFMPIDRFDFTLSELISSAIISFS